MQLIHTPLSSAFNLVEEDIEGKSYLTSGPLEEIKEEEEEPQTHELNLDFFRLTSPRRREQFLQVGSNNVAQLSRLCDPAERDVFSNESVDVCGSSDTNLEAMFTIKNGHADSSHSKANMRVPSVTAPCKTPAKKKKKNR